MSQKSHVSDSSPTIDAGVVVRTLTVDLDLLSELARLAIDLDTVMEVLLKRGTVEKTVSGRTRKVDDVLRLDGGLGGGLGGLHEG